MSNVLYRQWMERILIQRDDSCSSGMVERSPSRHRLPMEMRGKVGHSLSEQYAQVGKICTRFPPASTPPLALFRDWEGIR